MFQIERSIAVTLLPLFLINFKFTSAITCYDCPIGVTPCTATCTGATSCAFQVTFPLISSNQQMLRCERNITSQGCIGSLDTNVFICFCITDLCNLNINSTLSPSTATVPPPTVGLAGALPTVGVINGMMPVPIPGATTLMPMGKRRRRDAQKPNSFEFPGLKKVGEKKEPKVGNESPKKLQ